MKKSILYPAVTAVLGFTLGWALKPTPVAPAARSEPAATETARATTRPDTAAGERPTRTSARSGELHELPTYSAESTDEAKMLRLTEVLGLDASQREKLLAAIHEIKNREATSDNVLQDMIARGNALEVAISQILTPEQLEKFEDLRQRERENRVEATAQKTLYGALKDIDLSAEQRTQLLARLRQYTKEEIQAIPASAALLLENSVLPIGEQQMTAEGLLTLAKMNEAPEFIENEDPTAALQRLREQQKAEVDRRLQYFEGVLTPAQMAQYKMSLAKQRALIQSLPFAQE